MKQRRAWLVGTVVAGAFLTAGCSGPRVMMLTDKDYAPRPKSAEVSLYASGVSTSHEEIAILDSITVDEISTPTRELLIEDLRKRARRLGADAVTEVVLLTGSARGWVRDPMTPFRSWKQGWGDRYLLRGRAIRFKPLLREEGEGSPIGESFVFSEGERPDAWKRPTGAELEIYETVDRRGRRGLASRRKGSPPPVPRLPLIDPGD